MRQVKTLLKPSNECKHSLERRNVLKEKKRKKETHKYTKFHREMGFGPYNKHIVPIIQLLTIYETKGR